MTRLAAIVTLVLLTAAQAAATSAPAGAGSVSGSWVGTYTLGGSGDLALELRGGRALVALGPGHSGLQSVPASTGGGRLRFSLPGRPQPLVFDLTPRGAGLQGTVRQGALRGSVTMQRGAAPVATARGLFASDAGFQAVVADLYGPPRLVDLERGRVRALAPGRGGLAIGSGFGATSPVTGTARFALAKAVIEGRAVARVPLRQFEVRFASGAVTLAGTLTVPPGPGRHPAVAFVHGSGPTARAYLPDFAALLLRHGVAVLAYDKRGIGQSRGTYPGESPTAATIDVLARDARAAARFLAAQPEVDPARVGLAGHSQAGWIVPLAASRERAVRFAVLFAGPAVTADEVDAFQDLAGQGESPPSASDAEIEAEVLRRGPGGVDPIPWVRRLAIPSLWLYAGRDRHLPSRLSTQRLEAVAAEPGRDLTVLGFPGANHALVKTRTGLTSEMLSSDTFAPGLFAAVGDWLRERDLGG